MRLTREALIAERARRRALRRATGLEPVSEDAVLRIIRDSKARAKTGLGYRDATIQALQRDFERDAMAWQAAKVALEAPRRRRGR